MHALTKSLILAAPLMVAACGGEAHSVPAAQAAEVVGEAYVIRDTTVIATLTATGVAEPFAQSTLSTKLMGTVISVSVAEGDRVARGQPLVRIDARDIDAKRDQTSAAIASAEAVQHEAALNARRWRALYADSAAPRAQLDAAEAALARADAGVQSARAMLGELSALGDYATVRAPFAGIVTRRFVDPGAFAAPGAPLLTVQDGSRLRVSVTVPPAHAALVRRGMTLQVTVEGIDAESTVEGVVPAGAAELFTINALVANRDGRLPVGGAATLSVPAGVRTALLVPGVAIRREGDLTGVTVVQRGVSTVRWVRLGPARKAFVEVLAGLRAGDTIRVPHEAQR